MSCQLISSSIVPLNLHPACTLYPILQPNDLTCIQNLNCLWNVSLWFHLHFSTNTYHYNTYCLCYYKLIFHTTSCTQFSLSNSQCLVNSFLAQLYHSIYTLHAHCIPFSSPMISHASKTSTASGMSHIGSTSIFQPTLIIITPTTYVTVNSDLMPLHVLNSPYPTLSVLSTHF